MTHQQWQTLKDIVHGQKQESPPVGFIIDSPWLPKWFGISILDYFTSDDLWFEANLKAIGMFPDVMFLPGFWSEFGMCSEPSAFGSRCSFPVHEFPHAHPCIASVDEIRRLPTPHPETDGLAPLILNRLKLNRPRIEEAGHAIRFSVSRGPLNIAGFLMGTTAFLTAMMTTPDAVHVLLSKITDYLKAWHALQKKELPSIDGIFILDDILGFIAEEQFIQFALPCLKTLYMSENSIRFLHCDTPCGTFVKYLPEIGINLLNMGFSEDMGQLKEMTGNQVTMIGNIPPRDILSRGKTADIIKTTCNLMDGIKDKSRMIFSCGGGMPPDVSTENLNAFIRTVKAS